MINNNKTNKTVAFFVEKLSVVGGIERLISCLGSELTKYNFKVKIYVLCESPNVKPQFYIDKEVDIIFCNFNWRNKKNKYKHLQQLIDVSKLIKSCKADIIVGNNTGINVSLCLARRSFKGKSIVVQHFSGKLLRYWKFLNAIFYQFVDYFVVLTDYDLNYYNKLKLNNCICIPNFSTYTADRDSINKNNFNKKECIVVSNFHDWKHIDFIIKSFSTVIKSVPEARLNIYGDGDENKNLHQIIHDYKIANYVHIRGYSNNVYSIMKESTLLLFASDDTEAFGMVQVEALNCGLPVIAAENHASNFILKPCGIITKRTEQDFSKTIINVLSNEKNYLEIKKCTINRSFNFRLKNIIQQWISLLNE